MSSKLLMIAPLAICLAGCAVDPITGSYDPGFGETVAYAKAVQTIDPDPVYAEDVIPAATYGTAADAKTVVVPNVLLVRSDMSDANACALTKLLFDKKADLEKVHPAAKDLDPATAKESDPVQLHPGSEKALDGLG